MARPQIRIEVITPERTVLWDRTESIIVPSADGYLGVLLNHAPMVAGLRAGVLFYGRAQADKRRMAISGGFMEVADNHVTVLADTAELSEEIDVDRAMAAYKRAEKRLRDFAHRGDQLRSEMALQRAVARLQAAGRL